MSGHLGDLSDKQTASLTKFRDSLEDVLKPEHDDHYLLRWLRARQFDLKKSEKMLRDSLRWREMNGADTVMEDWSPPEVLKKYYPGGLYGYDKEGDPIWIEPIGYADVKGLLYSAKKSDILRYKMIHCEQCQQQLRFQSEKLGRKAKGVVTIFDLEKYGLKHLWKPAVDSYNEILSMFEAHYPEALKRCYVINAPRIFPIAYNLIKPFLSEETRNKVHVLGKNWKQRLLEDISADQLPVHWGGTMTDPDGDPFCRSKVNMGGDIPKELYMDVKALVDTESFTKATIGRMSSLKLDYQVAIAGSILSWQFSSQGKDIGFGVFFKTESNGKKAELVELVPSVRVNSHMVPEDGSITCTVAGTYMLQFDNTYSWLNSKPLYYQVEIIPPADLDALHTSPSFAIPNDASQVYCSTDP